MLKVETRARVGRNASVLSITITQRNLFVVLKISIYESGTDARHSDKIYWFKWSSDKRHSCEGTYCSLNSHAS